MTFSPSNTLGSFLIINQRFSDEWETFLTQITKINSDISRGVNIRDIAIYDKVESVTGRQWFNPANTQIKRDAFRQVFTFTAAGNITHNITNLTLVTAYGEYTDGTNFFGAIYGSNVPIAGQVTFFVTPTVITVLAGAGAPAIVSGAIVLNYLKN